MRDNLALLRLVWFKRPVTLHLDGKKVRCPRLYLTYRLVRHRFKLRWTITES